ncbi:MAG TPA: hypothetical protein VN625_06515 [Desulfuromonadaceae bacterium]|nr:hypothetical protein [Desulfuromonadaceae bacterium]
MKIFLSFLMFTFAIISAKAQALDPSAVFKQDGVLRISDGSSYYEFNTNGTFKSFPVGMSGRTFTGTWTSSPDINLLHFTVTTKMGWMNGFQPPQDDWRIIFAVYPGTRRPAEGFHQATFDCYWIIDELTKIPKPDK